MFDWDEMTILVLFVHSLCNPFRVHLKSCLVSFFNDERFHVRSFFEVHIKMDALGEDLFDVFDIFLFNVWRNVIDDLGCIPRFSNVFTLDLLYHHSWMQRVMDHCCSCHVNAPRLDFCLVSITDSWLF